jgi:hypothetical protein
VTSNIGDNSAFRKHTNNGRHQQNKRKKTVNLTIKVPTNEGQEEEESVLQYSTVVPPPPLLESKLLTPNTSNSSNITVSTSPDNLVLSSLLNTPSAGVMLDFPSGLPLTPTLDTPSGGLGMSASLSLFGNSLFSPRSTSVAVCFAQYNTEN